MTVTEFELLEFFGVEPVGLDEDVPWAYNRSTYRVSDGTVELEFSIEPASSAVAVEMTTRYGSPLFRFAAPRLHDVAVEKDDDDGPTILAVSLSYDNVLMISVSPSITVHFVAGASYF